MTHATLIEPDVLIAALRDAPVDPVAELALQRAVQSNLATSMLGLAALPQAALPKAGVVFTKSMLAWGVGMVFAAGVGTGLVTGRLLVGPSRPRQIAQAPERNRVPATATVTAVPEVGVEPSQLMLVETALQRAAPSTAPTSTEVGSSLSIERRILDEARHALAQGQPAAGIAPLERHRARFPKGVLTEEREALYVRVLAIMGNYAAALARAQAFERRFPGSIFLPAVQNAVGTISERNDSGAPKP